MSETEAVDGHAGQGTTIQEEAKSKTPTRLKSPTDVKRIKSPTDVGRIKSPTDVGQIKSPTDVERLKSLVMKMKEKRKINMPTEFTRWKRTGEQENECRRTGDIMETHWQSRERDSKETQSD